MIRPVCDLFCVDIETDALGKTVPVPVVTAVFVELEIVNEYKVPAETVATAVTWYVPLYPEGITPAILTYSPKSIVCAVAE